MTENEMGNSMELGEISKVVCPICEKVMSYAGEANYYDQESRYKTPLYQCKICDIFYRDIDNAKMVSHYYAASYVQKENESRFYHTRINFFEFILDIALKYAKPNSKEQSHQLSLIDFGSSYGHLLECAETRKIKAVGVELNEDCVSSCKQKGMVVYNNIKKVPEKVDIITVIDSLYYVPNCKEILAEMKNMLNEDGILVARITNRNLYTKFMKKYLNKGDLSMIGDVTISYSLKSIKKLFSHTGFKLLKVIPDYGKGKKLGFKKNLIYRLSLILTLLTAKKIIFTPGIIVIAKS